MKPVLRIMLCLIVVSILFPLLGHAQAENPSYLKGLQNTLDTVRHNMKVKYSDLIGVARGLAGLAALFFICEKVFGHFARNEAIDFYPILRPLVISLVIGIWPLFMDTMDGILEPTVTGTAALVSDSQQAVTIMLQRKEDALRQSNEWQMFVGPGGSGDLAKWEELSGEADSGWLSGISNRVSFEMEKIRYNFHNSIKVWLSELLETFYEAAALCINTVRIFYMIVLAIIGPLVFALSIWGGFHHILINWFARYVNVFLWLPVANIFGSLINQIQQEMIQLDIDQIHKSGHTVFGQTDAAYMIFLIMAIFGYFTVPTIASHIINPGHAGGKHLAMVNQTPGAIAGGAKTVVTAAAML